jgi:hypothetical protein
LKSVSYPKEFESWILYKYSISGMWILIPNAFKVIEVHVSSLGKLVGIGKIWKANCLGKKIEPPEKLGLFTFFGNTIELYLGLSENVFSIHVVKHFFLHTKIYCLNSILLGVKISSAAKKHI